jgi:hypothetical protein
MNSASTSAIAALAGSAIGALASFATTWLTQHAQERSQRYAQAMVRREHLYGTFIEEASKTMADALTHDLDDPSKLVRLYSLVGQLRLFAPADIVMRAEAVMQCVIERYRLPNRDFRNPRDWQEDHIDVIRLFSEACRHDLLV